MATETMRAFRDFAALPNKLFNDPVTLNMLPRFVSACKKLMSDHSVVCFGPWSNTNDFYQLRHIYFRGNGKMEVHYMDNTMFVWHATHLFNMVFLSLTDDGRFEAFAFASVGGELVMKAVELEEPLCFDKWFVRKLVPVSSAFGFAASHFADSNIPICAEGAPSPPPSPDGSDDSDEEEDAAKPSLKRRFAVCDESSRTPGKGSVGIPFDYDSDTTVVDSPQPSPKRARAEGDKSCSYIN